MSQTTVTEWQDWFAWKPVDTWDGKKWLRWVKRRRISTQEYLWHRSVYHWEYTV